MMTPPEVPTLRELIQRKNITPIQEQFALQFQNLIQRDLGSVDQDELPLVFIDTLYLPSDGDISTAGFPLIVYEVGYRDLRMVEDMLHQELLFPIQRSSALLREFNPLVSQAPCFFERGGISDESNRGLNYTAWLLVDIRS